MIKRRYVLTQILLLIPRYEFNKIVRLNVENYRAKTFSHWEHFVCLSYGQLAQKESVSNIVLGLNHRKNKLYHLGIKSTLSDANRNRPWKIFEQLAYFLIKKALETKSNRKIFDKTDTDDFAKLNAELPELIYALDSSTIDLCLSLFRWAKFRKKKEELSSIQYFISRLIFRHL